MRDGVGIARNAELIAGGVPHRCEVVDNAGQARQFLAYIGVVLIPRDIAEDVDREEDTVARQALAGSCHIDTRNGGTTGQSIHSRGVAH